jgi:nucleotide-binding universal stress UspA family protein
MPIKKILVPTDFSVHSQNAAEVAADLAKKYNAQLILLHALQMPVYESNAQYANYQNIPEGLYFMKLARQKFEEFKAQDFLQGVEVVEAVQMQGTYESIVEQATKHQIDLIVMGSRGTSGLKEVFVGSNTEKVIRLAKCPVLTIKERDRDFDPKSVLFVSDFDSEAEHVFHKAKEMVAPFGSTIHFLNVITPRNFESTNTTLQRMSAFAEVLGLSNVQFHIQNAETVEEGVMEYMEMKPTDLVVLGTHGRTGISHLIFGSVAEDIANHATFPVLSFKI